VATDSVYRDYVPRVAVIGGIGSGKSAVTEYLHDRGATVVDADDVARAVVAPGQPALAQLRDAFGDAILADDGTLDRAFVASIVFHDKAALARLNRITHTAIGVTILSELSTVAPSGVAVVALPLYRPEHREIFGLDEVWCVWVEPEEARRRLVELRHMDSDDADARLAIQSASPQPRDDVEVVIHNDGTLIDLHTRVDAVLAERGLLRD
jgi:dephospho-CoA kinase